MRLLAANPPTFYANKRWRHGRTIQRLRRLRCQIRGHEFGLFKEGVRSCSRACGGLTTRGDIRCSECGTFSGPMEAGWFGDLVGWVFGHGYQACPDCAREDNERAA